MFILPACASASASMKKDVKIKNSFKHSNNYDLYAYRHPSGQVAKNPNLWTMKKLLIMKVCVLHSFAFFRNLLCVLGVHLCFQTSNYLEVRMALSWWKDIFQRKLSLTNLPILTTHTRSSVEWILYLIQLVPCSFSCLE